MPDRRWPSFEQHICRRVVMPSGKKLDGLAPTLSAVSRTRDDDLPAQAPVANAVKRPANSKQRWPDDVEHSRLAPFAAIVIAHKYLKLVRDLFNKRPGPEPLVARDQPARRQLRQTGRARVHVVRVGRLRQHLVIPRQNRSHTFAQLTGTPPACSPAFPQQKVPPLKAYSSY